MHTHLFLLIRIRIINLGYEVKVKVTVDPLGTPVYLNVLVLRRLGPEDVLIGDDV